jgi:hypothetical protein
VFIQCSAVVYSLKWILLSAFVENKYEETLKSKYPASYLSF